MLGLVGVIMAILTIVFLTPLLNVFGATPNNFQYAYDYSSIIAIGMPFVLIGVGGSNFARTDGSPKMSMFSMLKYNTGSYIYIYF